MIHQRHVQTVSRFLSQTKTIIGHAELISLNGVVRCGGVVEKILSKR
jgi:hypothetical protein